MSLESLEGLGHQEVHLPDRDSMDGPLAYTEMPAGLIVRVVIWLLVMLVTVDWLMLTVKMMMMMMM